MLLLYTYINNCIEAYDAVEKEGFNTECFHVVCKTGAEAVKKLEENIKANKKLNKNSTYYIYVSNAYEYAKYWEDTHFIFDYYVGDIKVIEGKIIPEHQFDEDDFYDIKFGESFNANLIQEYDPLPDDLIKKLEERIDSLEDNDDVIKLETPYDHIEKSDEIRANIASVLAGGEFKPISIKISEEVREKFEKHEAEFHKTGFWTLQKYLSDKCKNGNS